MISQQVFSSVIDWQKSKLKRKKSEIIREKLLKIPQAEGFVSVITGVRRCGKSTLQLQIMQHYFSDKALFLNFEDPRLSAFEIGDFERLYRVIEKNKVNILFFDEIQLALGWEIFVNQLLREGFRVYVTGSNASVLSRELGTRLTGRHLSGELFPFSYTEFLKYKKLEKGEKSFRQYAQKGGMPDYLRTGINTYLNNLLDDILIRDIAIRHSIKDVNSLRQLAVYLLSNIGNLASANKLKGMFGIKSATSILDYFSYLQDAYLIEFVPLFDYSIKKQIRNPQKIYAIDLGIYHQNKIVFSPNEGHILENLVYLHLRRKGKEIYYFQKNGECDFVVCHRDEPQELYQVCTELNSMNTEREIKALLEAMTYFNKKEAWIITQNQTDVFRHNDLRIQAVPAWQWMSN